MKTIYAVKLWDSATPAFAPASKLFAGSKADLFKFAEGSERCCADSDAAKGIREYFAGNKDAKHYVADSYVPAVMPVRILAESENILNRKEWDHINTWGYTYEMAFKSAIVKQIVVKSDKRYCRMLRVDFEGLEYSIGHGSKVRELADPKIFWGNEGVFTSSEKDGKKYLSTVLYVEEEWSKDKQALINKINDPELIIFDSICNEIFADG